MMKKIWTGVCLVGLLLATLLMTTSCGSFFEEEALQIAAIDSELLEDGRTKVTISYANLEMEPHIFYIPKGEDGETGLDGKGIKEIVGVHDASARATIVTITFTDDTVKTLSIPDGRAVVDIREGFDEEAKKNYFVLVYSDDTLSAPVYLPKGDKGNGIVRHESTVLGDGSVQIYMEYDNGETMEFTIPAAKAIAEMTSHEENGVFFVDIRYTDGSEAHLDFPGPAEPNAWLSGADVPSRMEGKDGDYFFDTYHKAIYLKINGSWDKVISFKEQETEYSVSFDLNDSDEERAYFPQTVASSYKVKRGEYFAAGGNGEIPTPYRPGYIFKGWYTKNTVNEATMSPFTDLTPVFSDLQLYAYWIPDPAAE